MSTFRNLSANTSPFTVASLQVAVGAGTPEGAVTADAGSIYLNSSGGAGTSLYSKESGAGNTGWVGVAPGAGGDAWGDPVDAVITPDGDATRDFGLVATRFATGYFSAVVATTFTGALTGNADTATTAGTVTTAAQPTITSVGTLAGLTASSPVLIGSTQVATGAGTPEAVVTAPAGSAYLNTSGGAGTSLYLKESGAGNTGWVGVSTGGGDAWGDPVDAVITPDADGTRDFGLTATRFATGYFDAIDAPSITGALTGNASTATTAGTVTTAAQTAITSVGTLTALDVDNININLNTISASVGALNLTPFAGSAIVLDGTINVDAGVVTGATSITSTVFQAGGTVSTAGDVRIANAGSIQFRNAANSANISALSVDSSNLIRLGAKTVPGIDSSYELGSSSIRWSVGYFDAVTVGGRLTLDVNTSLNADGQIIRHVNNGFNIRLSTGVNYDFIMVPPGGSGSIIRVATGTTVVTIVGEIDIDGALNHDGSTVGFYGTTPVALQTGVAVTAGGVHAALVNLGLITA